MTILPRRSTIVPLSAEVQQVKAEAETDVPAPSDVLGTMKYWDEYRARERQRFAAMDLFDDNGNLKVEGFSAVLHMDEAPTPENLSKKAEEDAKRAVPVYTERPLSFIQKLFRFFQGKR